MATMSQPVRAHPMARWGLALLPLALAGCGQPDARERPAGEVTEEYAFEQDRVPGIPAPYQRVFPPGTMEVVEVEIGGRVGHNMRIAEPAEQFEPDDPIYAVAVTEGGRQDAELAVRWQRADGEVLERETARILPGRQYLEFGLPRDQDHALGAYRVEFFLDGRPAGGIDFEIVEEIPERGLFRLFFPPDTLRGASAGG
jgi:hypothetical protein